MFFWLSAGSKNETFRPSVATSSFLLFKRQGLPWDLTYHALNWEEVDPSEGFVSLHHSTVVTDKAVIPLSKILASFFTIINLL